MTDQTNNANTDSHGEVLPACPHAPTVRQHGLMFPKDWQLVEDVFKPHEFACRGCPNNVVRMDLHFMMALWMVRLRVGLPLTVTSGYRCPWHNQHVAKSRHSAHVVGKAADVQCADPHALVSAAFAMGMNGIGVNMRGPRKHRFIHMDSLPAGALHERPAIWSY